MGQWMAGWTLRQIILQHGGLFIFSSHNNCIPRNRDGVIPFLKSLSLLGLLDSYVYYVVKIPS